MPSEEASGEEPNSRRAVFLSTASTAGLSRILGTLKTPNPARDQHECETDDPGPCRKRLANFGQTKMRSKRNEKQNQRNNPYNHRWSFTGVVHFCVFLLFVESEMPLCGSTKGRAPIRSVQNARVVTAVSRCFHSRAGAGAGEPLPASPGQAVEADAARRRLSRRKSAPVLPIQVARSWKILSRNPMRVTA